MKRFFSALFPNRGSETGSGPAKELVSPPPRETGGEGQAAAGTRSGVPDLAKARRECFDIEDRIFWGAAEKAAPFSLLTIEKLYNLYEAVRYVSERGIPGDFVECGVYKGGAIIMMADALLAHGYEPRRIHLFDTFTGFTGRSEHDVDYGGREIGKFTTDSFRHELETNLKIVPYPNEHYVFVEGDVIQTSRDRCPDVISLLRLDTDTYDTTRAELENMFPRLSPGGVLIVDDYGYSRGCRKATDDFFAGHGDRLFLQRPNKGSRTAIKC